MSTVATIERTAFSTSRLLDFVSEGELTKQCGYAPADWPLVVVKELIDNALDACEEHGLAPEITVAVEDGAITVADNGPGIPPQTVEGLLDFSMRVSSREAYVAPDRGAQGNALKTLVAMPFVLDGDHGRVDICGGGVLHEIELTVDRIQQRPAADVRRIEKDGSFVRLHWPVIASSDDDDGYPDFTSRGLAALHFASSEGLRTLVEDFAFLNPHATLAIDYFGQAHRWEATDPQWRKWMPSSPTCPHWYEPEHLERLLGACVTHDLQEGRERTVREFVSEFKGMSSTVRQKQALDGLGLSRSPVSALLAADGRDFDHERVALLLAAVKAHTKPVKPSALGMIGRAHMEQRFAALDVRDGSFEYRRVASLSADGLPQVTEVAFAALSDEDELRRLVTGVNWSAAWVNPFRRLGATGQSLDTMMSEQRFERSRPIALLVHVAHPRVQYSDRGKSTVISE